MYKEFYQGNALLGFPLFALLFFVTVFTVVVVRALRRRETPRLSTLAQLPLNDEPMARATEGTNHVR